MRRLSWKITQITNFYYNNKNNNKNKKMICFCTFLFQQLIIIYTLNMEIVKMEPTQNLYNTSKVQVVGRTCNMAGSGINKINQDAFSFVVHTDLKTNTEYIIVIVCDGHGINGDWFANKTVEKLNALVLSKFEQILKTPQTTLEQLFHTCGQYLKSDSNDKMLGGTAATVLIKTPGHEIVANIGDCDVLSKLQRNVYNVTESTCNNSDVVCTIKEEICLCNKALNDEIFQLSEDHTGESDKEVLRVLESADCALVYGMTPEFSDIKVPVCELVNGKVVVDNTGCIKRVPYQKIPGIYANNVCGSIATYFADNITNKRLNMTRAFGDYCCNFVVDRPSVCELVYPPTMGSTTIIGSDGYFNCLTKNERETELGLSAQQICDNSVGFVEKSFGTKYADNMTVVAITIV